MMGTPAFAVPTLEALVAAGHEVVAVYSQPPRPAHRGKRETPSPIHTRAQELGIEVRTPRSLRDADEQAVFAALDADVAVVAAYGLILPQPILDAPRHGCLNVHASLLPRWRGAAPIVRAILAGDAETGVGIMQMEAGLDTGPVLAEARTPIARKTSGELTDELAHMGAALMVEVLGDLPAHPPRVQPDEGVTYARKIDKSEATIDWHASDVQVERHIRAFAPAPGAWASYGGERLKILAADVLHPGETQPGAAPGTLLDEQFTVACNPGAVRVTLVQRAGRGAMTAGELLRGFPLPAGTRFDP